MTTNNVPANRRITGYPYLVQRLFAKNQGDQNPPEGAEVNISSFFRFDYMGSAEFEFGAIPKAKQVFTRDLTKADHEPVKIKDGEHVIWYVGPANHRAMAETWFHEELLSDYTGMKERSQLRERYIPDPTRKWELPSGWFCIDGGRSEYNPAPVWGMFTTKDQARDFLRGVLGK